MDTAADKTPNPAVKGGENVKRKVSVLIPFFNEESVLPALFERMTALMDGMTGYDWEVLLVNDGSTDSSLELVGAQHARDSRFRYVDLSRNYGKEVAMMAGFDYVTGDCMVIMDADLQHPPEVIPTMIGKWEEGYDDVFGQHLTRGKGSWLRKQLSLLYYRLLSKSTRIPVQENTGDFRLLDRCCIEALKSMRECQRYTKGMYSYIGFRKIGVPFVQADRQTGKSKWSYRSLFALAVEGITSYTTAPLRIATFMGIFSAGLSLAYLTFVLIKTILIGEEVRGFPTLIVTILFIGGILLLSIGIIGEYIGRIFNEVKQRPVYFVREVDGEKK